LHGNNPSPPYGGSSSPSSSTGSITPTTTAVVKSINPTSSTTDNISLSTKYSVDENINKLSNELAIKFPGIDFSDLDNGGNLKKK